VTVTGEVSKNPTPEKHGRRAWGWAVLSVVLIVIGCLLAPSSVVAAWGKESLVNTDSFVATYAPLAKDPAMHSYVVDQTMLAIDNKVDTKQISANLIDGIKQLGPGPRADAALDALQGPVSSGLENLLRTGVTNFVHSDAFATAWKDALTVSHKQLTAMMRDEHDAVVLTKKDGVIGIQLGPIVQKIKENLVNRGLNIAKRIPTVNRTIPIADASKINTAQATYQLVVNLGTWLLWVCLAFVVVGILAARRRLVALIGASLGLALVFLLLRLGFVVGRNIVTTTVSLSNTPAHIPELLFNTATAQMQNTATAGVILTLGIALITWIAGPFPSTARLRAGYSSGVRRIRSLERNRGMDTGKVGDLLYEQRVLIRVVVALAVAAIIILSRPLSVGVVVATAVVALVVLAALSLIQGPWQMTPAGPAAEGGATRADSAKRDQRS
jgi:hypothetical protein